MAKQQTTEEWKILSDTELVSRARRLTIVGLVVLTLVVGGLGYLLGSSPVVQETSGPARPVRLKVAADKSATPAETGAPSGGASTTAQLPPNPWVGRPDPEKKAAPAPARPPSNQVVDL